MFASYVILMYRHQSHKSWPEWLYTTIVYLYYMVWL